ncbi:MAG: glycosyltransferase family 9 protein [Pirellulales bacterium]
MPTISIDSPRFLISRMSAIGDTVLTLPVACALRARFPEAFIGWAVEEKSSAMVVGHPCVDQVFTLPRGWFLSLKKCKSLRDELRAHRFTVSIDCQGNTKSSLACWLSGARHRIGCRGQYGTELSTYLNNILVTPERPHLTDRCVELLAPIGLTNPEIDWQLPGNEGVEHAAAKLLADLPLQGQFAIINPGATWESKLWEMDRFAAVARYLGERRGLKSLVVWGSNRELDFANQIVSAADGHAVLAPRTSLQELVAVLRQGTIFISSDTGPLHMSVAVGTPSIGLYGATRPADCGPYGSPHAGIQVRYESGSRNERRKADNSAMREISVERVCCECDHVLDASLCKVA